MCILYSFSITIIKDSPFSLSLFSWYQSIGRKKNPNYFQFIRESILGNLSVTVFHSDHPSHLLKLPINPHRRRPFPVTFPAKSFSNTDHTIRCARRRSLTFLKAPEEESQPRASLLRRPESHAPACEGAWGIFRPRASTSSLA